jgi:hypothetical protein
MNPASEQKISIDYMDEVLVHCISFLKQTGMDDEAIRYHISQHARKAEMYAEDIERGAMHLNKGFEKWVNNN